MGKKTCIDCFKNKDIHNFYKKSSNRDGFGSYCKQCHNIRNIKASKKWLSSDKGKKYMRSYSAKIRTIDKWKEYNKNYSILFK